ncbi:hypothetical protein [Faecalimicrobium dakarense]|uniref:hypothetical protein n=1 Tax=Faecalimicrobium dakarense TaxID=1301100 RepID=UPI0004B1B363|nr:hypothetical protein [[Clostridium] dakarense]
MIKFNERFMQLCIERNLDCESFKKRFYESYGYFIETDSLCNEYIELLEFGIIKDLCNFFDVSFAYLLGISSNRGNKYEVNPYDEVIGICSVVFTSDKYSSDEKKELYLSICKMFNE